MIQGQTNVTTARFGAGSIDGIGKELGRFVVTTMEVPWRLAQPRLGAAPTSVLFVESMEIETVERQVASAPDCDPVLAIGGGQRGRSPPSGARASRWPLSACARACPSPRP